MLCRACGMQSRTTDICEWCKKPLSASAHNQPTTRMNAASSPPPALNVTQPIMAPPIAPQVRVSLTGEVIEVAPVEPTVSYGVAAMPSVAHAELPTNAINVHAYREPMASPASIGERWEMFLAWCLPLLILSVAVVHQYPNAYAFYGITFLDVFLIPLIMSVTRIIPSYDDAVTDCGIMLGVCFLFGPLISLVVYLIVAAIKQECNIALVALLVTNVLVTQFMRIAFINSADSLAQFVLVGLFAFVSFFGVIISFAGWLIGGMFRPLNE